VTAAGAEAEALGLYVHLPFCEVKCAYCHFAIDPRRPDDARRDRYRRALALEMRAATPAVAETLYFGGGTPSLVPPREVAGLVSDSRRLFALPADAEITLEANPRDLDEGGYGALREAGINRLSIGVQSLDDGVLRDMNRPHTAADAPRAVGLARAAGFENVSLDLILGWPGETRARWTHTLDEALRLRPDHLSLYLLEVEEKTALAHDLARGRLAVPPDDDVADLYQETVDRLGAAGLEQYEISNFARPGFESRHNARYWDDQPFLGFGMSAHSYRNGRRWWNHGSYGAYCRAIEEGGGTAAVAGSRSVDGRQRLAEAAFTGLRRRQGVDLTEFQRRYGRDLLVEWGDSLRDGLAAGLLERTESRLKLTDRGRLLSNEVFRALV
jgi:oxygen-independent coproporphyrinogen-3 oxidase